jgi:hypothetical protein
MNGKSYKQWLKEVKNCVIKKGYSAEFADAIAICVRGFYFNNRQYTNPGIAASRGLNPPLYERKSKKQLNTFQRV